MYYSFIINPIAGGGIGKQNWEQIERYLQSKNLEYQHTFTNQPGDATEIAQRMIEQNSKGPMVLITVGGDGTLDEVLSGLLSQIHLQSNSAIYSALIPSGLNNHFAKAYGISSNPIKAFQLIQSTSNPLKAYVGHYHESIKNEDGYFINSLGIGFDGAMLSRNNSRHRRRHPGFFSFMFNSLSVLYNQAPFSMAVQENHQHLLYHRTFITTCANHNHYQSINKQHQQLFSPTLTLTIAERHNWLLTLWILGRLHAGKLGQTHWGHEFQGQHFHLTTTSLEFVQKDGIEIGNRFVDMTIDSVGCQFWQQSTFN